MLFFFINRYVIKSFTLYSYVSLFQMELIILLTWWLSVFWDITPCQLVQSPVSPDFEGPKCHHHQGSTVEEEWDFCILIYFLMITSFLVLNKLRRYLINVILSNYLKYYSSAAFLLSILQFSPVNVNNVGVHCTLFNFAWFGSSRLNIST